MPGWRLLAAVIALAGYGWLSHWLMIHAPAQPWTVAALFGPLLAAIGVTGLKKRHWPTIAFAAVCVAVVIVVVARGGVADVRRLYVLQHGAINAVLCWTFAMTLRPGSMALITMLGEKVHTNFTQPMRDYTRWLTGVWALYFAAMIVVSVLLYTLAPWEWWSFFCNALTPLAAIGLFAVEHLMRYRRHPEFERVSIANALRAYQSHSAEAR